MCFNYDSKKKLKKILETRPCQTAAKRSIMLLRAPMPFWHIVKVVCTSVYQIKTLCDEVFVFFLGGGGGSLVCHLFHP